METKVQVLKNSNIDLVDYIVNTANRANDVGFNVAIPENRIYVGLELDKLLFNELTTLASKSGCSKHELTNLFKIDQEKGTNTSLYAFSFIGKSLNYPVRMVISKTHNEKEGTDVYKVKSIMARKWSLSFTKPQKNIFITRTPQQPNDFSSGELGR